MEVWAPLVPQDCLFSDRDVIPGAQRCTADHGLPTRRCLEIRSQLSPPALQPVVAVQLSGLTVQLPEGFLEVVRRWVMPRGREQQQQQQHHLQQPPQQQQQRRPGTPSHFRGSSLSSALPLGELRPHLRMRAAVHNGRRFVGPAVLASPSSLGLVEGQRGQHRLAMAGDLPLAWLPADDMVAIVLELLLTSSSVDLSGSSSSSASAGSRDGGGGGSAGGVATATEGTPGCTVLAWGAFVPFVRPERGARGSLAVVQGQREMALRSGPGRWVREQPLLDWRRLLERTNRLSPEPPVASFTLQEAERQGIWPPPASAAGVKLRAQKQPAGKEPKEQAQQAQREQGPGRQLPAIRAHRGLSTEGREEAEAEGDARGRVHARHHTVSAPDGAGPSSKAQLLHLQQDEQQPKGPVAPHELPLWQIQAHYEQQQAQEQESRARKPEQGRQPHHSQRQQREAGVQAEGQQQQQQQQWQERPSTACAAAQTPEEQPAAPGRLQLRAASCPRLVWAWPALEEGGAIAQELAGMDAVSWASASVGSALPWQAGVVWGSHTSQHSADGMLAN